MNNIVKCKEIPLTEKILIELGFSLEIETNLWVIDNYGLWIKFINDSFILKSYNNYLGTKIEYVHQLQNKFLNLTKQKNIQNVKGKN